MYIHNSVTNMDAALALALVFLSISFYFVRFSVVFSWTCIFSWKSTDLKICALKWGKTGKESRIENKRKTWKSNAFAIDSFSPIWFCILFFWNSFRSFRRFDCHFLRSIPTELNRSDRICYQNFSFGFNNKIIV